MQSPNFIPSRPITALAAALLLLALPNLVGAHHSFAMFDKSHTVTIVGTIKSIEWTNPHVFIFLDVKDDSGAVAEWRVEGNSPNMLVRTGWKREMIKSGDQLTVNGAPERNGAKVLRLITLTLANGQKYDGQGFK